MQSLPATLRGKRADLIRTCTIASSRCRSSPSSRTQHSTSCCPGPMSRHWQHAVQDMCVGMGTLVCADMCAGMLNLKTCMRACRSVQRHACVAYGQSLHSHCEIIMQTLHSHCTPAHAWTGNPCRADLGPLHVCGACTLGGTSHQHSTLTPADPVATFALACTCTPSHVPTCLNTRPNTYLNTRLLPQHSERGKWVARVVPRGIDMVP